MEAVRLADSGNDFILLDLLRPQPAQGEVLVEVRAAGVTPSELAWYPTRHRKDGGLRIGAIPGHEFSGVIAAVGEGVGSLEVGHEVFGMNDWYADGALAEYCVAPFFSLAPKPRTLTDAEAASVPIAALTAWQGLFDRAQMQAGDTVLIHGGAGSVGTFAVQLARMRGARVIATASAKNRDFVAALGAHQVIDYRAAQFDEILTGLDVVFDTVGGETLERSWKTLGKNGRMVTIAAGEQSTDPRAKRAFFIMEPNQRQLVEIGCLLDAGKLRAVVDSIVPLERAADVFWGKALRQGRGKVVVEISSNKKGREANGTKHQVGAR